jgi:hypothetical protein
MSDEKGDPVKQVKGILQDIVRDPKNYFLLALGFIIGVCGAAGAGWGLLGEKTQSAVLDVLDPSGRRQLQQDLEKEKDKRQKAENHVSELEPKLAAEKARADKAEAQLALIDPLLPVEITATPITCDEPKAIIKLEFHNRSPKDFQFGFGPSKPQLVVPGYETSNIYNSIPGDCWNASNCFDEFGIKYHAITLQPGENRVIVFEFWLSRYSSEEFSTLQKKGKIELPVLTSEGRRTVLPLPMAGS